MFLTALGPDGMVFQVWTWITDILILDFSFFLATKSHLNDKTCFAIFINLYIYLGFNFRSWCLEHMITDLSQVKEQHPWDAASYSLWSLVLGQGSVPVCVLICKSTDFCVTLKWSNCRIIISRAKLVEDLCDFNHRTNLSVLTLYLTFILRIILWYLSFLIINWKHKCCYHCHWCYSMMSLIGCMQSS